MFSVRALAILLMAAASVVPARAGDFLAKAESRTELKAVFGRVEARNLVEARARIGGTIVSLAVEEGSAVKAGDVIADVVDDKLALELNALDARLKALKAQLENATAELGRGSSLFSSGAIPKSKLDALQTAVDVLTNQISAAEAERSVNVQQASEGQVLAPAPGRVLAVPVTKGSVVLPGETIARIAGGGYFLRLSLPERHAALLHEGDTVLVGSRGLENAPANLKDAKNGKVVKIYPEIEGGRVLADVEVEGLGDYFAGERTLVWIPVGQRQAIGVPPRALTVRYGIDYVNIEGADGPFPVAVIVGGSYDSPDGPRIEVLSGLQDGDRIVIP